MGEPLSNTIALVSSLLAQGLLPLPFDQTGFTNMGWKDKSTVVGWEQSCEQRFLLLQV